MDSDFSPEDFWAGTPTQRIAKCRDMAAQAERLAAAAIGDMRGSYTELAKQWHLLADELEAWEHTAA
jgi:hypothetical protein